MALEPIDREELVILAKNAGLNLPEEYFPDLVDAYGHVQEMLARLHRGRARGDEPAHVFVPKTFLPAGEQPA
ncbi:hypothetical protein [Microvirga makkahensis]|uniref:DUF4089 domain-containing protein n=1 Tax=Microvirga makkahensis TaxID=1128670 RepID=A0A7X3SRL2_9HYPH|nr:hypothetical protein [Microvirga makkahensis]MXQ14463.1 hypothetical protein [Microvirga makkahensis]